jgi:hypothetical protein
MYTIVKIKGQKIISLRRTGKKQKAPLIQQGFFAQDYI